MQITEGNKASLIVGANDYRLNDQFQNVENVEGENYIRLEFDFSGVSAGNGAKLNIYRVGYAQGDSADTVSYTHLDVYKRQQLLHILSNHLLSTFIFTSFSILYQTLFYDSRKLYPRQFC